MNTQFGLDEFDVEALVNLMLRSQQSRTREALCLRIGIDPKRLGFIKDSADADFVVELITYLNEIGNKEAICKLCCLELIPIFSKSEKYAPILTEIAAKLHCDLVLTRNNPKNKQTTPTSLDPSFPNQPDDSKPESLFTKIGTVNKKLLASGAIIIIVLAGYPTYEYLKQPPQLVEYQTLREKATLAWSETNKGEIGEYREGVIPVKSTHVNLRNFIVEAQFHNPYDGAMDNWTYGFAFQENTSDKLNDTQRKSFDVWVASKEKEWRFGGTSRSSNGKLSNLNVSDGSSNKLSLVVKEKKAIFFVNDMYIQTFDLSEFTNKGDVFLIAKDGRSGKSVQYTSLKVWSLDN
ncbi:hypothetical protein [Nostoc sp. ChiQUE01b]|uniref:hypothetical protein n=1 Tax=Nostoc sp. ChiQUE01b TaxID=3075376 RepID=UPI002AD3DAA4|nr:hypothetical protein [Nostoc sp. ChiQUE01b]MDZ8258065.1 hypothetical protein [Nostoc sp. ChiQUE01b]